MLLVELNQPEPILEAINFQVLQTFRCVSHLILCAVILWCFQKKVTTDSTFCVALRGRYVRDDTWILRVCTECMGDIQGYWYVHFMFVCVILLKKCLLYIKCSALRDVCTLVAEFFFMRAREASVLADTSSVKGRSHERRMKSLWHPGHEKKLEKRKGYLLITFRHSLFSHYRLNDCLFLIPVSWSAKYLILFLALCSMPSGHPGHQGSRMPGSSWYPIVYSCPSFYLTHPSRRYGILMQRKRHPTRWRFLW